MDSEIGIPVNPTEWKNGTLVSLKTHFYSKELHSDLIVYSGEPKLISPLMVIVESQPEKDAFDALTGDELSKKGAFQCKCIWFSGKTFQIEDARISSRLLRIVKEGETKYSKAKYGDFVELKGSEVELGKKKSSLKFKNNSGENTVTAELSFVSPIMQVIGTVKNDIKEPLRDPNTQKPKKFISKTLVKCKYYNSFSDKMTEALIPIEALNKIDEFDHTYLNKIKEAIDGGKHLLLSVDKGNEGEQKKLLLSPKRINYRAGRYFLSAFDFFSSKMCEFELPLTKLDILDSWYSEELPSFKLIANKVNSRLINAKNLKEFIEKIGKDKCFWIIYTDFKDDETKRVISGLGLIGEEQEKETSEEILPTYLKAYCHLRQADRLFKIDGIKAIKALNI